MTFAAIRSFGCFVYFEREVPDIPARALLESVIATLGVAEEAKISTKNDFLRWSNFTWKKVDAAIDAPATRSISMLVGTPDDVRLAGGITLRVNPQFIDFSSPPVGWFAAESERWPAPMFTRAARDWLRIAAKQGTPLSGGVLAAADLRNAKVEITQVFHTYAGENPDRSPRSFRGRMEKEKAPEHARRRIRRVYPVTLLGPKFASHVDASRLAAAGATNIEHINGSIIFDATPKLHEAWSAEYLAATVELRRLLWPISFQNPADDPDPRRKSQP